MSSAYCASRGAARQENAKDQKETGGAGGAACGQVGGADGETRFLGCVADEICSESASKTQKASQAGEELQSLDSGVCRKSASQVWTSTR
jgi:hypothetical protein